MAVDVLPARAGGTGFPPREPAVVLPVASSDLVNLSALAGLSSLAAAVCGTAMAGVWVVDQDGERQGDWYGLEGIPVPIDGSPCGLILAQREVIVFRDLDTDPRFATLRSPHADDLRFYAGAPVCDSNGDVVGVACVLDRVPRTLSEPQLDALRTIANQAGTHLIAALDYATATLTRNRLQSIFDSLPDAVVLENAAGEVVIANQAWLDLGGLTQEDFRDPEGLAVPKMTASFADFATVYASAQARVQAGVPVRGDELLMADGRIILRDYTPIAVEGDRRAALWRMRDVTAARRDAAELESAQHRLYTVASAIPMGLIVTDGSSEPVFMNAACSDILGLDGAAVTDENWGSNIHADDYEHALSGWEEAIRTGVPVEREYRVCRPDETVRHVRAIILPVADDASGAPGYVALLADVTDQAETAAALAESHATLKEQNEELETLARARDDLVAAVSHELRTPLTSISSFLELLLEDPSNDSDEIEAYEVMQRNTERLKLVVGDLLLLKDNNLDAIVPELAPVDLTAIAADVVVRLTDRALAAGLTLSCPEPDPVWATGNADRLAQAVDNLVVNALKFTPMGGTVTLRTQRAGGRARLVVEDSGVGIAPAAIPHVFDRFFQAQDSGQQHRGSGLGLAIVKELIAQQHGSVTVRSTLGEGATFTIDLAAAEG